MKAALTAGALVLSIAGFAWAQGGECPGGLCGTPDQSGGAGGGPCVAGVCTGGCGSVLVAMTDRGDTYQFADDFDGDGIEDEFDNCPFAANYDQADADGDGVGDGCDHCPSVVDPGQADIDGDRLGDACDPDLDGDGVANAQDNCLRIANATQTNTDLDGEGDDCDLDDDNDGLLDRDDPCRLIPGSAWAAGCDDDQDGDGIPGSSDNCPSIFNPELDAAGLQADLDADAWGDACDLDIDGDGVANWVDNCLRVANPSQIDLDHDGRGDAGNWRGGAESCDPRECYVVLGDQGNCLDPNGPFSIYLSLVGERIGRTETLPVGSEVTVALFSNRLGRLHRWTTRFTELPADSETSLSNGKGGAATLPPSPQVAGCVAPTATGGCDELNTIRFVPDVPGRYAIKVTATLPQGDELGPDSASYTIIAEVEGEPLTGGCAAGPGLGAVAVAAGLMLVSRRRRT